MIELRRCWLAVGALALCLVALPATRQTLWPSDFFWLADESWDHMPAGGDLTATARRLDQPWAWAALAENEISGPTSQALFRRAIAADPDDEAIRIRQAVRLMADLPNPLDLLYAGLKGDPYTPRGNAAALVAARQAVDALIRQWPDNAYGHYLAACVALAGGDEQGCRRALAAGNAAERMDDGLAVASARLARLFRAAGYTRNDAALGGAGSLVVPELSRYRGLARWAAARAHYERTAGRRREAEELCLAVAVFGGRRRDCGDRMGAFNGIALQTTAAHDPSREYPRSDGDLPAGEEIRRKMDATRREFETRLAAAGLGDRIPWVQAQWRRSMAIRVNPPPDSVDQALQLLLTTLRIWAVMAGLVVLSLILGLRALGAAMAARTAGERPLAMTAGELLLVALPMVLGALPGMVATVLVGRLDAIDYLGYVHPTLRAVGGAVFGGLLGLLAAMQWLASRHGRRCPGHRAAFVRRLWPTLGSALAALTLAAALLLTLPAAALRQRAAVIVEPPTLEHARLDALMDRAEANR